MRRQTFLGRTYSPKRSELPLVFRALPRTIQFEYRIPLFNNVNTGLCRLATLVNISCLYFRSSTFLIIHNP